MRKGSKMVEVRLARRGKAGFVNELVDLCIGGGVAVLSGEGFDDFGDGSAAATGGETEDGSEDGRKATKREARICIVKREKELG